MEINLETLVHLFVFDMANNHMGSVEHGLRIIREMHNVSKDFNFHFGLKLQYRHLDTFIHPDFKHRMDVKYVKRFSETRLSNEQLKMLRDELKSVGFIAICTPFDEQSVDLIEEHDFDIIKIASCSFTDWPLLERIVKTNKPIIASTAGVPLDDIDKVVSFFENREKDFALMHCVAEYPTPDNELQLNQIDLLKHRYPDVIVGYSTHERLDNVEAIKLVIAKGARIFEKHVGVPTDQFVLNAYSATPDQIKEWLECATQAFELCGIAGKRSDFMGTELASLRSLRRGVFAKSSIKNGERVYMRDLFFAIPTQEGQLTANDMSKYTEFYTKGDIEINAPLFAAKLIRKEIRDEVYKIVQRVKELIHKSGVVVPPRVDLEISHHYGIDRFYEYGLTMLTVINRGHCKKIIIMFPGQTHPEQYHDVKDETFHILYGSVLLVLDGVEKEYITGDVVTIDAGTKHSFSTVSGVILDEISSSHHEEDSFYTDPIINLNEHRKTFLTYWL